MKKIALDLDGCLIGLKAIDLASEFLGYNYKEEDSKSWNMEMFPEDLMKKVKEYFSNPVVMCDKVKVIPEAQQKVREWYDKRYDLHIITARVEKIRYKTIEMLAQHYPEIKRVHFVDYNESKQDILIKIKPDVFIDDGPHNILDAMEVGINTILISNKYTKYNHHLRDKSHIKWVKHLGEIEI